MSPTPLVIVSLLPVAFAAHFVAAATRTGDLPRNHAVGIKTRATRASAQAWAAGHRAALPWLRALAAVVYAAAAAVLALTLASGGKPSDAVVLGIFLGTLTAVLVLAVPTTKAANRAARATIRDRQGSR